MEKAERNIFVRRWGKGVLWLLIVIAAVSHVSTFFNDKFSRTTGAANWIWDGGPLSSGKPRAFFVSRDFDLPADRRYVHLKVAADPEYTLFFNGREVGGYRGGDPLRLDVYDVSALAHDRANRIVVAVRSRTGAGGLIVSIDLAPNLENAITSDATWLVSNEWSDALLSSGGAGVRSRARLLGRPPFGKWNYLPEEKRELRASEYDVLQPVSETSLRSSVPETRAISGVVIRTSVPTEAKAFDFGFTRGRVRFETAPVGGEIRFKFANTEDDLTAEGEIHSFVSAPGETWVVDPMESNFRYVVVYGNGAKVTVLTSR